MKQNQKGFSFVELMLVLIFIMLVSFAGWYIWNINHKSASQNTKTNQTNQHAEPPAKTFTNSELAFTFKYPLTWTTLDTTTDYGFYHLSLRAPGTVVESCTGECIKSGAEISLNRNKVGQIASIEQYKSANAQFLSNEKDINLGGVDALEYDNNQTASGGTSLHGIQFYKDNIDYSFTLDSTKYRNRQYGKAFDSIINSIKFNN